MSVVDDVREGVTRKLGPLPVWGWAIVVGLPLGLYLRSRTAKATAAPVDRVGVVLPTGAEGLLGGLSPQIPGTNDVPLPGGFGQGNGGPINIQGPTTNNEWRVAAERFLLSRQYDGAAVIRTMQKVLVGGQELSPQETQLFTEALQQIGSLPEPTYDLNIPTPTPAVTVPPESTGAESTNPMRRLFETIRGGGLAPGDVRTATGQRAAVMTPARPGTLAANAQVLLQRFAPALAADDRHVQEYARQIARFMGKGWNPGTKLGNGQAVSAPVYIRRF